MNAEPQLRHLAVEGFACTVNDQLGHLSVGHDGTITWDQLQAVKTAIWGAEARAIEVYPAQSALVNTGNWRHLWRLGAGDFAPNLLEHEHSYYSPRHTLSLEYRSWCAWYQSQKVFR